MFDLSSSWVEGSHCELAAFGHSRDGKRGRRQIEYGLLTDPAGRPVAVRAFAGNTADPSAFTEVVTVVREKFALGQVIMVGDRGMITSARIRALRELAGMAWITCLRAPAIKKLMADGGPLQLSLFDEQDLAEITSGDFPGERLIACRNPVLAAERARKREDLLRATEDDLGKIAARAQAGRLKDPDKIGLAAGQGDQQAQGRQAHHPRDHRRPAVLAARPGIHRRRGRHRRDLRHPDPRPRGNPRFRRRQWPPTRTWPASNATSGSIKADDLDLRPIWHRLEDRVRAHVLICMLACYLTWHLRQAWAPLTYTDEHHPARANPVAPARRSPAADAKAARKTGPGKQPIRGFRGLLDHLATLTRNDLRYGDVTIPALTEPTPTQRRAFDLIGTGIPLTLAQT